MNRTELMSDVAEGLTSLKRLMVASHGCARSKALPTRAQIGILFWLAHAGPSSLKTIAEHSCMSSSAATQLVDGLVRDRMLTRREDGADRRKISLELTASGKRVLIAAKKFHIASLAILLEPLSDAELLQWKKLQQKIIDHRKQTV